MTQKREVYDYQHWKDNTLRLQLSIITGTSYRFLWHSEVELLMVLSGDLEYYAGNRCYRMSEGDIIFFNRNCGHSIISQQGGNQSLSLKLNQDVLKESGICVSPARPCVCITQESCCAYDTLRKIQQGCAQIRSYLEEGSAWDNKFAELIAILVFSEVLRTTGLLAARSQDDTQPKKIDTCVEKISEYITQHLTERISLQQIADVAGYNRTYLSEAFRRWTGFSVSEYINQFRIQKAISLLENGDVTLTDVALSSGFPDYGAFSSCMVRWCGKKPLEYRNAVVQEPLTALSQRRHYPSYPDEQVEQQFKKLQTGQFSENKLNEIKLLAEKILYLIKS